MTGRAAPERPPEAGGLEGSPGAGPHLRSAAAASWLVVAAGLAGAWIAWWGLPLPEADPLRSTLVVLPAAAGAFAALHRLARRQGARRLSPALVRFELVALVAVAAAGLARTPLGLSAATPALAAALAGLGILHGASQAWALRPLLERPGHRRLSLLFFALPAVLYLALLPWAAERRQPDGDEPYYLLLAHSLSQDLDADLADEYADASWRYFMEREVEPQPGDPRGPEGEVYSRHGVLLPLVLAGPYRVAGRTGALAAMALLAALLAWLTLDLARRYDPERPAGALLAYALLALLPPLVTYAHQVWVEVPGAVLVVLALLRLEERATAVRVPDKGPAQGQAQGQVQGQTQVQAPARVRTRAVAPPETRSGSMAGEAAAWLALALPLALLPVLKLRFGLLALAVLALAVQRLVRPAAGRRARRGLVTVALLVAAAAAALLAVNQVRYGNPLKIHAWQELALPALSFQGTVEGLLGLFWDCAFGLFAFAPLWLLVVPAVVLGLARRSRAVAHLAVVALPYLVLAAPRAEWYGGWSPPFRYGVALLPLLAVVLVPLLDPLPSERRRVGARLVLGGLGALTLVLALVWLAAPGLTYDLADGRTRLLDALSVALGADVARFFPSFVRPRLASWLWPLLSALVVTAAWWLPRRPIAGSLARWEAPSRRALAAGAALALLCAAAVPVLASLVPTRVVEAEDPWVLHRGGRLHPETWVVTRSQYRAGWVLRPGEALEVPLIPGGRRVRLVLEAQLGREDPEPPLVELRAGGELLGTWRPDGAAGWERVELGPFDWPAGDAVPESGPPPLVVSVQDRGGPGRPNGILFDRLELEWE
ncbi:MAG: hypothetical protein ACLF0P_16395 [Thermoanaerobaculia bacterium]